MSAPGVTTDPSDRGEPPPREKATAVRPRLPRRFRSLPGVAVALVALAWAVRGIDLRALGEAATRARPFPILGFLAAGLVAFLWRASRLERLSGASGSLGLFVRSTAVGNLANVILPARGGELVRCWMLSRRLGTPFAANLALTLLDRLVDVALFAGTLVAAGFAISGDLSSRASGWLSVPSILGVVALAALAVPLLPEAAFDRALRVAARLPPRSLGSRLAVTGRTVACALAPIRGGLLLRLLVETAAIVAVDLTGFWFLVHSIAPGVPFPWVVYLGVALVLGLALPGPPAGLGLHQAITVVVLGWRGVPGESALVISVLSQGATLLLTALLGSWSLAREGTTMSGALEGARAGTGVDGKETPPFDFTQAGRSDAPSAGNRPPSPPR